MFMPHDERLIHRLAACACALRAVSRVFPAVLLSAICTGLPMPIRTVFQFRAKVVRELALHTGLSAIFAYIVRTGERMLRCVYIVAAVIADAPMLRFIKDIGG